jgi:hypothetical protein
LWSTDRASVSICGAVGMISSASRSHCTSEPAIAIEPSTAYTGASSPRAYATVGSTDGPGVGRCSPVLISRNAPVP